MYRDRVGEIRGRLTVLALSGFNDHNQVLWRCACSCGSEIIVVGGSLTSGNTKSCGCLVTEGHITHGHSRKGENTAEYRAWRNMRQRCFNPKNTHWQHYGGRGITVCPAWRDSFELFLEAVGPRPSQDYSLDRIDNDGNYEPGNVRWAGRLTQTLNRRSITVLQNRMKSLEEKLHMYEEKFGPLDLEIPSYNSDGS